MGARRGLRFLQIHTLGAVWLGSALGVIYGADPFAEMVRTTEPLTPEAQGKKFHLPPGFEIQLVASEPQIAKPMNMAFDARGRLWITESREYPFPAPAGQKGRDAIKILVDSDGDGRAEQITTFAEDLNIPIGLYPYQDGVVALSIPNIYRFRDTNHDGKADSQTVVYGPIGFEKDTHGLTSGFRRGFDGWLYACHGFNNTTTLRGTDGSSITMHSGNTYRMRMDGSRLEQFTWGQVNPFGLAFDPLGSLYSADCHSLPIYQLLRGGHYPSFGKPHDGLGFAPPMMRHSHESTAIGGIAFYAATQFPEEFQQNFFVGNVMTSRINRDRLVLHGSTPEAQEAPDFLSCDDPWFRPVDLQLGPDGALYVADFYNRIIGHYEVPLTHPGRDRERGRIWRIAYVGTNRDFSRRRVDDRPKPDLREGSVDQLIKFLAHDNLTVRMLAMNELTDRIGTSAIAPVTAMVKGAATPWQKSHGLWVLQRLGAMETNGLLDQLAGDRDVNVRVHVMRALAELPTASESRRRLLRKGLTDSSPLVQRAAADALGQHPAYDNITPLLDLLRAAPPEDTHLIHVVRMALRNQFRNGASFTTITKSPLKAEDYQTVGGMALGIPSAEAAGFILTYLQSHTPPPDRLPDYLRHVARYGGQTGMAELAQIARGNLSSDLDLQLTLLKSIQEGAAQGGRIAGTEVLEWAADLAAKLLASTTQASEGWTHALAEEARELKNPWILQRRGSADGDKGSLFLSSLKPGGETLTGIVRSAPFVIPARLSFFLAGHDGYPGKPAQHRNGIRLRALQTGQTLAETFAPRNDVAQRITWELTAHQGQKGYLEIADRNQEDAYAWIAVGRIEPAVVTLPSASPSQIADRQQAAADLVRGLKIQSLEPVLLNLFQSPGTALEVRVALAKALQTFRPDNRRLVLAALIGEPLIPTGFRLRLNEQLIEGDDENLQRVLLDILQAMPGRGQVQIARTLAGTPAGREELLKFIEAGAVSPRLLLDTQVKDRMTADQPANVRDRLSHLMKDLTPIRQEVEKLIATRQAGFDSSKAMPGEGAAIFQKNCAVCHQIDGKGGLVGPQLDGVGNRGLDRLCEDILDPNQNVDRAFRTQIVVLAGGDVMTGLARREEGKVLVLADSTGKEISIPEQDIKERRESELSLMPDNYGELLSPKEFNDLMSFLLSKGSSSAPAAR